VRLARLQASISCQSAPLHPRQAKAACMRPRKRCRTGLFRGVLVGNVEPWSWRACWKPGFCSESDLPFAGFRCQAAMSGRSLRRYVATACDISSSRSFASMPSDFHWLNGLIKLECLIACPTARPPDQAVARRKSVAPRTVLCGLANTSRVITGSRRLTQVFCSIPGCDPVFRSRTSTLCTQAPPR